MIRRNTRQRLADDRRSPLSRVAPGILKPGAQPVSFTVRSLVMQGDTAGASNSPAVGLFQKAHGKMVMLQRLDAQLSSLLEQRRKIQDELSAVQNQINDEFDRVMRQAEETPARILNEIADTARNGSRPIAGRLAEPEAANA
jgi:hypothetical protein